jgi:Chaperone of endosialidase
VGDDNTAFGYSALRSNTTGIRNTASGLYAMRSNTTGSFNTASGGSALYSNTTGWSNTASGFYALQSNTTGNFNAALGVEALRFNTTGRANTASGTNALRFNTTGTNNTATGLNALRNNTAGSNNTALGNGAGSLLTTGSNNIYVGHPGVGSESSTLRLGNVQTRAFIKGVGGVPISGLHVTINAAGQLGVAPSSERYKQNILPLAGEESQKVHQLRPVTFHYKTETNGPLQYGLIAEEVAKVYPELVTRDENGVIEGIRYEALTPLLLKEVQGQHQQIATQAQQLVELKAENQNLRVAQNQHQAAQDQQLAVQAQQMQTVLQQVAELKLQNDSLRAAVERFQGPAAVAMTAASRLQ